MGPGAEPRTPGLLGYRTKNKAQSWFLRRKPPVPVRSVLFFTSVPQCALCFNKRKMKSSQGTPVSCSAPERNTAMDARGACASRAPSPAGAPRGPYLGLGRSLPRLFWHHLAPSLRQRVLICDGSHFWGLLSSREHTGGKNHTFQDRK